MKQISKENLKEINGGLATLDTGVSCDTSQCTTGWNSGTGEYGDTSSDGDYYADDCQ